MDPPGRSWHALTAHEASDHLGVDSASGLSEAEARARLARLGPNRLSEEKQEPIWEEIWEELREPMILLLLVTGILYSVWGGLSDALTIFFVIFTLVGVEILNERRAQKAIAHLRTLAEPTASVRRSGRIIEIPVEQLAPGDVILLGAGRHVPADARLIEAYGLMADESLLTGESAPVEKEAEMTLAQDVPLAERRNLVYAGATITRGRGAAVVVATGMITELGQVASLTREIKPPPTPLQETMRELTRWMVWVALGFSVVVPLSGWLLSGQPLRQMLLIGLSLAFATIPEEGPIIITMVLALGAYRLSGERAIVKNLRAIEALGAITVIATDKTGTLTENRMEVKQLYPQALASKLLEVGTVCNDATEDGERFRGDPLEVALLSAARQAGLDVGALRRGYPLRDEFTFDNVRKRMSVVCQRDGRLWIAAKGAPEAILSLSVGRETADGQQPLTEADRQALLATAAQMAHEGLRVIALAEKTLCDGRPSQDQAESGLNFVGLMGLADPPRPAAREAIAECRMAGIRPIMITGDHPLTARAIASQVGLDGDARLLTGVELDALPDERLEEIVGQVSLYARTTPQHKLRIVRALRQRGERVAVTGDGTNDAPALVAADIGIAMGETGSDVARASSDIVLADDNFRTIIRAVEEGRILFANLSKGLRYYLACKVALVLATLLPVLLRVPVPFAPIQIILMELFMDLAASATFVAEPGEPGLMRRPPRDPGAPFMDRAMVSSILSAAAGLFAVVSVAYLATWYSGADLARAQTMAFVSWLLGHVFLAINMRSEREPLLRLGLFTNRVMWIWGLATVCFVVLVTLAPGARAALRTSSLSGGEWVLAIGLALAGTFWMELRRLLLFRQEGRANDS